ncbi:kinase-like domain-containing protein [Whalleya microplaca]|nr:kinase-like domain-containing protein [Whalleya microplaca]
MSKGFDKDFSEANSAITNDGLFDAGLEDEGDKSDIVGVPVSCGNTACSGSSRTGSNSEGVGNKHCDASIESLGVEPKSLDRFPDTNTNEFDARKTQSEPGGDENDAETDEINEDNDTNEPQYWPMEGEDFEDVQEYILGGYHPIHLGDTLNDRFEVVTKLGQGGYATVWLCLDRETNKWRAIKVLAARHSHKDSPEMQVVELLREQRVTAHEWETAHIALPLDEFWIEGPNGRHLCFVLPVLGPRLTVDHNDPATAKKLLFEVAKSLQFLHQRNICHGDFRTSNILMGLEDIDHLSKEEMIDLLGEPDTEEVGRAIDNLPGPLAPDYLVKPANLERLGVRNEITIVDFGISYHISNPPEHCGIPCKFAPPEAYFDCNLGFASDLWSFACTIAEVRIGHSMCGIEPTLYVKSLELLLGPLPEPYRTAWAHEEDAVLPAEADQLVSLSPEQFQDYRNRETKRSEFSDYFQAWIRRDRGHMEREEKKEGDGDEEENWVHVKRQVPVEEVPILADLLSAILKYDPKERITLDVILDHEWFKDARTSADNKPKIDEVPIATSPTIPEPETEPAASPIPPKEELKPTEKAPEATTWRVPGREEFRRLWESVINSRVAENLRSIRQWQVLRSPLFLFSLGFALVSVLGAALLTMTLYHRPADTVRNPDGIESCHQEVLLVPTTVRSCTSTYFEGVIAYSTPKEPNGTCSCPVV